MAHLVGRVLSGECVGQLVHICGSVPTCPAPSRQTNAGMGYLGHADSVERGGGARVRKKGVLFNGTCVFFNGTCAVIDES